MHMTVAMGNGNPLNYDVIVFTWPVLGENEKYFRRKNEIYIMSEGVILGFQNRFHFYSISSRSEVTADERYPIKRIFSC